MLRSRGRPPTVVSSDDDSPMPPGPRSHARIPGAPLNREQILARARAIDRSEQEANRAANQAPPKAESSLLKKAEQPPAERARGGEDATVRLGLAEHLLDLTAASSPPPESAEQAAALAASLEAAVAELTACERQQQQRLQESVGALKSEFRGRLEALEADFVRRAQALSDELALSVATHKQRCAGVVSARARELAGKVAG